jgi:hypothetical protein
MRGSPLLRFAEVDFDELGDVLLVEDESNTLGVVGGRTRAVELKNHCRSVGPGVTCKAFIVNDIMMSDWNCLRLRDRFSLTFDIK